MPNVVNLKDRIPAMSGDQINKVKALEDKLRELPQIALETFHTLHGGVYSRTAIIPANSVSTGALIKVPTTLIIQGDCTVYVGSDSVRVIGYQVIIGCAGRKQAFAAHQDTVVTMIFKTNAKTVEQAEDEFTDDARFLMSRMEGAVNNILIGDFT